MNVRLPFLSGALVLAFSSTGYCLDSGRSARELLANDKEEVSHLIGKRDIKQAKKTMGSIESAKPRLENVASGLAELMFEMGVTCEPEVFVRLGELSESQGFGKDLNSIKQLLVAMRSVDLIDDLILLPLFAFLPVADQIVPAVGDARTACPTDQYTSKVSDIQAKLGGRFKRKAILSEIDRVPLPSIPSLPEFQKQRLRALYSIRYEELPFTLSRIVRGIKILKNSEVSAPTEKNHLASKMNKNADSLTYRMSLYQKYDDTQLTLLSNIMKRFNRRNRPTTRIEINFIFEDGTDEVERNEVSGEDKKYTLAVAKLYAEMKDTQDRGTIFQGKQIETDDVVMAAIESGLIKSSEVNRVLKVSEIWDPKVTGWKKVVAVIQKYGGPALVFAPPPFNILASTALTLLQTSIFKQKSSVPDALRASPF